MVYWIIGVVITAILDFYFNCIRHEQSSGSLVPFNFIRIVLVYFLLGVLIWSHHELLDQVNNKCGEYIQTTEVFYKRIK